MNKSEVSTIFDAYFATIIKVFDIPIRLVEDEAGATEALSEFAAGLISFAEAQLATLPKTDISDAFEVMIMAKLIDHVKKTTNLMFLSAFMSVSTQVTLTNKDKLRILKDLMESTRPHVSKVIEVQKELLPRIYEDFMTSMSGLRESLSRGAEDVAVV